MQSKNQNKLLFNKPNKPINTMTPKESLKSPEELITYVEFFDRLNKIPNYTAENIRIEVKDGWVTIKNISVTTTKL